MPKVAVQGMTKAEAREAMDAVVDALEQGLSAFDRARAIAATIDERDGYKALGFRSMAACLAAELSVTRRRAYQILDQMRASSLLSEASGEAVVLSARQAADVLAAPPAKVAAVAERVRAGEPPRAAVQAELPVTRSAFRDSGSSASFDFDEGVAIYRCRHCQRTGPIAELRRCIEVVREEQDAFG